MFKDCFQVENFGMEVKDFEGAVKMQGAMMDKLAAARLLTGFWCSMKNNKDSSIQSSSFWFLKVSPWRERGKGKENDRNPTSHA